MKAAKLLCWFLLIVLLSSFALSEDAGETMPSPAEEHTQNADKPVSPEFHADEAKNNDDPPQENNTSSSNENHIEESIPSSDDPSDVNKEESPVISDEAQNDSSDIEVSEQNQEVFSEPQDDPAPSIEDITQTVDDTIVYEEILQEETGPVQPLVVSVEADRKYAFANSDSIRCTAYIKGGRAPYNVSFTVEGQREDLILDAPGNISISFKPTAFGTDRFKVQVTDAAGTSDSASVSVPIAEKKRESEATWRKSVSGAAISGIWADDLVAVARTQIGYRESTRNFIITSDDLRKGYTRYGAWYHSEYSDWCAMFVSFCLHYAKIPSSAVPYDASCNHWVNEFKYMKVWYERNGYMPKKGDIIFFDKDETSDGNAKHVGIVCSCKGGIVSTIEGNAGNSVAERTYSISDKNILGYASLSELEAKYNMSDSDFSEPLYEEMPVINDCQANNETAATEESEASEKPRNGIPVESDPYFNHYDSPSEDLPPVSSGTLSGEFVNLRSKAGMDAEITAVLPGGTNAILLGEEGNWRHIRAGGFEGYIYGEFFLPEEQLIKEAGSDQQ